ncbi:unnamed protein product [Arabis nemorensis]|uniref:Uncharacterized protein n=1 Tax=Arabis nemorensis TaxID=586526 RepID=A0A565C9D5_9BRAS|nr:unnamed protein product [Arabis nemorensis]
MTFAAGNSESQLGKNQVRTPKISEKAIIDTTNRFGSLEVDLGSGNLEVNMGSEANKENEGMMNQLRKGRSDTQGKVFIGEDKGRSEVKMGLKERKAGNNKMVKNIGPKANKPIRPTEV